ncbi:MAG: DUF4080 domain-containing protein, partial [Gammaproteobacteria bacterium]|nr:DUF4080 domain-containing protein [Gammaproteobacteria bacterium]
LSTRNIDFYTLQTVNRFARYWDMIANSGRFQNTLPLILGQSAFDNFLHLSDSLYQREGSTWKISLKRLFTLLYTILTQEMNLAEATVNEKLRQDFLNSGEKSNFDALINPQQKTAKTGIANKRQAKQL